jgi:Flp pilus assembly pilin Flp
MLKAYLHARTKLADLRDDAGGAALIEYSLLIGLIVVGAVAALTAVGVKVGTNWGSIKDSLPG